MSQIAPLARRQVERFPGAVAKDDLPWLVIAAYDADIRGNIERDRRIEDERDRVLIAAVKLAETPTDDAEHIAAARHHLIDAIDYIEQLVVRFGMVNREGRARGL